MVEVSTYFIKTEEGEQLILPSNPEARKYKVLKNGVEVKATALVIVN